MKEKSITELIKGVQDWARDKGIYEHSTAEKQWLYIIAETGELADAINKGDRDAILMEIGDVAVTVINYTFLRDGDDEDTDLPYHFVVTMLKTHLNMAMTDLLYGVIMEEVPSMVEGLHEVSENFNSNLAECLSLALDKISKRTGKIENGVFVKDSY